MVTTIRPDSKYGPSKSFKFFELTDPQFRTPLKFVSGHIFFRWVRSFDPMYLQFDNHNQVKPRYNVEILGAGICVKFYSTVDLLLAHQDGQR